MVRATALVLRNVIEVEVGSETWLAKPVASTTTPIARQISALFSTNYETFRPSTGDVAQSTVSYSAKKDEILIQVGEMKWRTRSTTFGPMRLEHGGSEYEIHEKLTGKFWILRGGDPIAHGQLGFRSCEIRDYPPDLENFLGE
ncbi:MAG TPA: hypothetical protein VLY85_02075, partial [Thermoplasmata archaeon]|nr:hypothetical protein [Thermoplasmata archaeon]